MQIRSLLPPAAALLLLVPVASAAPGDTAPGGPTGPPDFRDPAGGSGSPPVPQREGSASVALEGRVTDSAGKALMSVPIKLFTDGVTVTTTTSLADGTFRINANPMHRDKGSAVLWVQSPDPEKYVDASVVLWASDVAKSAGLFSPCTPSLEGALGGTLEVTLRSADELKASVVASKCLGGS